MFSAWIVGLAGIWMFITPFIGFTSLGYAWIDWIVGVVVAIFGFSMVSRAPWQGWVAGVAAVWLFVSGFIPGLLVTPGVWWNDLVIGVVFAICGFAALGVRRPTTHSTTTAA